MRTIEERPPRRWVLLVLAGGFSIGLLGLPIGAALVVGGVLALAGVVVFGRPSWRSAALLAAALLFGFSAVEAVSGLIVPPAANQTVVKIYEPHIWTVDDPVVGYRPRPGTAVRVEARYGGDLVFRQTYTIDPSGERATPGSKISGRTYLFIGDSFIFGEGLSDADTLPAQFASRWPDGGHVVNLGVLGYAPNQLVRAIETGLYDRYVTGSVAAVVTWIQPVQLPRVTGDASWLGSSPRFVLEASGKLRHTGTFAGHRVSDPMAGLSFLARSHFASVARGAEPALERERGDLYVALIARLRELVRQRYGAPLVVLYDWPDHDDPAASDGQYVPVFQALAALDVPLVPVRKVMGPVERWNEFVIPHDAHPNARLTSGLAAELVSYLQQVPPSR